MKRIAWFLIVLSTAVLLYAVLVRPKIKREEQRRRAELYMLDVIKGRIWNHLDMGGQLPTNWVSLSNSINSQPAYSQLALPTDSYSILQSPATYNEFIRTGVVFMIRSKPVKWVGRERGRWVLVRTDPSPHDLSAEGTTNRLFRRWLPESRLLPEIRRQLTNETGN